MNIRNNTEPGESNVASQNLITKSNVWVNHNAVVVRTTPKADVWVNHSAVSVRRGVWAQIGMNHNFVVVRSSR